MKALHLKISLPSLTRSGLEDLKEAIIAHKGFYKVFLHLISREQQETVIVLSDQYTVDPSQNFQNNIKNLFNSSLISFECTG
jgi:hypothetical protein